ncbi:MAG TPA: sigma-54 dependent transcriptional regulator [Kofleriaceae bacterium]|nr:sigma-54 dependent transcriptional regulator [Kofleriaceae bacterium]
MIDAANPRADACVLVVEDDDAMRDLLVEELADAGFTVLDAPGARAGVDLARDQPIDLVITDLRMPDLDGFDLIRDIKATAADPHIVMITAFGSIETAIRAVKLGAYDYITKPFEIEELILIADKALSERKLRKKVDRLQREVERHYGKNRIVAHSAVMRDVLSVVERVATSEVSVLITGESGTGKELVARAIHYGSPRAKNPFVAVNIAAIPESLIEAELFGYKRGAFTDARQDRAGLFAEADHGTLFLDEIAELSAGAQVKFLRALQEQEIRPIGATGTQKVDVRVVAATNRDLEEGLADGSFREDLYYRLNVVEIDLPPLRDRRDDILPLAATFLEAARSRAGAARAVTLSVDAQRLLLAYRWPGNVRELQNSIERGLALCRGDEISIADLPAQVRERTDNQFLDAAVARKLTVAELEREYIERVLDEESGNKTRAAQRLGLDRKTLYRKLEDYKDK